MSGGKETSLRVVGGVDRPSSRRFLRQLGGKIGGNESSV